MVAVSKRALAYRIKCQQAVAWMDNASTERAAFLRAITEKPHDMAPRLVFADWLDEEHEKRKKDALLAEAIRDERTFLDAPRKYDIGLNTSVYMGPKAPSCWLQVQRGFPFHASFLTWEHIIEWLPALGRLPLLHASVRQAYLSSGAEMASDDGVVYEYIAAFTATKKRKYDGCIVPERIARWVPGNFVRVGSYFIFRIKATPSTYRDYASEHFRLHTGFSEAERVLSEAIIDEARHVAGHPPLYNLQGPSVFF